MRLLETDHLLETERDTFSNNNIKKYLYLLSEEFPNDMPLECRQTILSWKVVSKSPL